MSSPGLLARGSDGLVGEVDIIESLVLRLLLLLLHPF